MPIQRHWYNLYLLQATIVVRKGLSQKESWCKAELASAIGTGPKKNWYLVELDSTLVNDPKRDWCKAELVVAST
jgi:hypothetical protein